ncbi:MAG: Asp-tRNA(Asn)/Glu-tRNA(Gln) amidotransferase subunit GatC [Planctomycetota bacterium]|nr:MAG: Asp-tRNA(Asn)/Glu-tRNA(Gln) amidotransferase subunit GatC [Planctomycetota bacterium]
MALSEDDVRKVAALSQLALDEEDIPRLRDELSTIISFVEQLQAVDVTGIDPVAQVTGLVNVTRPDNAGAMLDKAQLFAHAPAHNNDAFLVPKAVER